MAYLALDFCGELLHLAVGSAIEAFSCRLFESLCSFLGCILFATSSSHIGNHVILCDRSHCVGLGDACQGFLQRLASLAKEILSCSQVLYSLKMLHWWDFLTTAYEAIGSRTCVQVLLSCSLTDFCFFKLFLFICFSKPAFV